MAPKFGENVAWHPACFQCTTCAELLVDLTYCVHEDQLYCERHYAEQLKPRCAACDEVSLFAARWFHLFLFCFFYISTFITHSTLPRLVPFRRISTFFFRIGTNPGTFNHALFVVAEMCPVLELLSSLQSPPLFAAGFRCPSRVGSLWTPNARDVN